ncbi:MAG: antibiotic biosynthesis monooxygenase family protein [Terriglobales bacterium]
MIDVIWTYRVKPERMSEFEKHYAPNGSWARLFRRAQGFGGTTLLHDVNSPDLYATIDRWDSLPSFDAFKKEFPVEYAKLDQECSAFATEEQQVGTFSED